MNSNEQNKKCIIFHSYEDYIEYCFGEREKMKFAEEDDPMVIGSALAEQSISNLRRVLKDTYGPHFNTA